MIKIFNVSVFFVFIMTIVCYAEEKDSSSIITKINGVWLSQDLTPNSYVSLMFFSNSFFVIIRQNSDHVMIRPKEKFHYRIISDKKQIELDVKPREPNLHYQENEAGFFLRQSWGQWPFQKNINYKKITIEEGNAILKTWKISDIDWNKIEIGK